MEKIKVKMPIITLEQKQLLIKALNYYRISGVEFSYASDEKVFYAANLMEIIDSKSIIIKDGEK